jgi:hypothetical protein
MPCTVADADRRRPLRLQALLAAALLACGGPPEAGEFQVGATRAELLAAHGEPAEKQTLHKTGEAIWGPIEGFWAQVPAGGTVETWSYPVQDGSVELYFVDGSQQVQGMGFAPEGAVFEPER